MIYTVLWKRTAEAMLAHLWNTAADRAAVTVAAHTIDRLLRRDPGTRGESRSGPVRVLIVPPLAVHVVVEDADCTVFVLKVWRMQ